MERISPGTHLFTLLLAFFGIALSAPLEARTGPQIGFPFNRSYSLEEVGVSRSVQLAFDPIGRLAAIDRNRYVVLNDSSWINLLDDVQLTRTYTSSAIDEQGNTYFGALASWGELRRRDDGKLERLSVRPADAPDWVDVTSFSLLLPYRDGVFFAGINGIVFWNRSTDEHLYFEVPDLLQLFELNGRPYLSSHSLGIQEIDLATQEIRPVFPSTSRGPVLLRIAEIGNGQAVVCTTDNELALFDGQTLSDWENDLGVQQATQISNLLRLPDGDLALSIDSRGLFILSQTGDCKQAFTSPEYHRINHLAARESGVLWVVTESDIQKILYSDPATLVDQRSGVSVSWPHLVEQEGRDPLIVSHGTLYEIDPSNDPLSPRYRRLQNLPGPGVLGALEIAGKLIIGNRDGVYQKTGDRFTQILGDIEVNRLIKISPRRCLAIGRSRIAALEWDGKQWFEPANRIDGVGFPYISLATDYAVWLELGSNRAARITLESNEIRAQVFEDYPWRLPSWVHLGVIDNIVVMDGEGDGHLFFDEKRAAFTSAPELERLLAAAPSPIYRPLQDESGTIWAAHKNGIYAIERDNGRYRFDTESYRTIRIHVPILQKTGTHDIWVSNGDTLFHVDQSRAIQDKPAPTPILVSVHERNSNNVLYSAFNTDPFPQQLPFSYNNLELQFFAGTYSYVSTPAYVFEMKSGSTNWTIRSTESNIELTNLQEDSYQLSAQLADTVRPLGPMLATSFTISPPWFRTGLAYGLYWTSACALVLALVSIVATRSKRRRAYLESLVNDRTEELRTTLEKLNEKERNAVVLSERNRLASEIHDSVQQGLSGLALQLEATLKRPELAQSVRSRLDVAKNMVSFTRHEVQQAIWGLESPLLENSDLATALEKMVELIGTGKPTIRFETNGTKRKLPASAQHHLLRIAQEAVTNAIKHADCQQISILLDFAESSVTLQVSDDGKGFLPDEVLAHQVGHFGMRGMRGRAAKIRGELKIESTPGKGAQLSIFYPLPQEAELKDNER